jgi:hypothetical protein
MHVRKLLGVAVAALLLMTAPANAHLQERDDPRGDVDGGKLDIKRVGLSHSDTRFSAQMLMWESFRARSLGGGSERLSRAIAWAFDSRGGPAIDYGIILDYRNGELIAYLVRVPGKGELIRLGNIDDVSKDGAFVKVSIRQSRMETRGGYVRWAGQTNWEDNGPCSKSPCLDVRPEQGGKTETLINHNL